MTQGNAGSTGSGGKSAGTTNKGKAKGKKKQPKASVKVSANERMINALNEIRDDGRAAVTSFKESGTAIVTAVEKVANATTAANTNVLATMKKSDSRTSWLGYIVAVILALILGLLIVILVAMNLFPVSKNDNRIIKTNSTTTSTTELTSQPATPTTPQIIIETTVPPPAQRVLTMADATVFENRFSSNIKSTNDDVTTLRTDMNGAIASVRSEFDGKLADNTKVLRQEISRSTAEAIRICDEKIGANSRDMKKFTENWRNEAIELRKNRSQDSARNQAANPTSVMWYQDILLYNDAGVLQTKVAHIRMSDISQQGTLTRFVSNGKIQDYYQPAICSYPYSDGESVLGSIVFTPEGTTAPKELIKLPACDVYRDSIGILYDTHEGHLLRAPKGAEYSTMWAASSNQQ